MHDGHGCWASQEAHPCLLLVAIPVLQGALLLLPVPDAFVELDGEADDLIVAQRPLLLLQDLSAVLTGAVGDLCQGVCSIEIPSPFHLIFKKPRDQFVDDVLKGFVRSDAQQRPSFVDLHVTHGAVLVGLQVAHDARFAEGMQALHDGSGVDEVPPAEGTHEVRVQLRDFDPCGPMHDAGVGAGDWGASPWVQGPVGPGEGGMGGREGREGRGGRSRVARSGGGRGETHGKKGVCESGSGWEGERGGEGTEGGGEGLGLGRGGRRTRRLGSTQAERRS